MRELPLNGLRVLAATLEAGGVRAASRFLQLSPSVVHRHLRELEARIGVPLIERGGGRKLRFTAAGQRLGRIAAETLGELAVGVEATIEDRRPNEVVIATTESFAGKWLLPRLARFDAARGRYTVSIKTDRQLSRIPADADLAIRLASYVDDSQPASDPFMDEVMVPVLSPGLAASSELLRPEQLLGLPLLHDRDPQVSWRRWCGAIGADPDLARSGMRLTSSALVQSAAMLGMGAGLARRRLAEADLVAGRLVELSQFAVPIGTAYWIIRRSVPRAAEQFVLEWLRREAGNVSPPAD